MLATGLVRAEGSLTLAWDYETEEDLAGFRIYYGFTSGFYALTNEAGLATSASISNLLEGETYYFAVSSLDLSGRESDRSNEIAYPVPVSSTNDVPALMTMILETDEGQDLLLPLSGTSLLVAHPPSHGQFAGSVPEIRYIPDLDFSGPDSFKLFSFNGGSIATRIEVSVNVRPVNDPPWTADKTVVTVRDIDMPIQLVAGDADADALEYVLETQPESGSLSGNPPHLHYHPAEGFEGLDGFTYRVRDGEFDSDIGTVSINVLGVDGIPIVEEVEILVAEDVPKAFLLNSYNPYRGSVSIQVMAGPLFGALPVLPPAVEYMTYHPGLDFHGADAATFLVRQSDTELGLAKVRFVVAPVNDRPWAFDKTVVTVTDIDVPIHLVAGDDEAGPLRYTIETPPVFGSLAGSPPDLHYQPAEGFEGEDGFTYRVNDGEFESDIATVSINVLKLNRIPVVEEFEFFIEEDVPVSFLLNSYDPYRGLASAQVLELPLHGELAAAPPKANYVEYRPALSYSGTDNVLLLARRSDTELGRVVVKFVVVPVNDPPEAHDFFLVTFEDTPASLQLTGYDEEGARLNYEIVGPPEHGTLSGAPPNLVYLPTPEYNGFDRLRFRVDDGDRVSFDGTVTILVIPVNDAPTAMDQSVETFENRPASIVLRGEDVEGDALRYEVVTVPEHGVLIGEARRNLLYIPAPAYRGPDRFTFKVKDASSESEPALVTINVFPAPEITATRLAGSNLTLNWSSLPGWTYRVLFSDSLSNPWRVVSDPMVATGPGSTWTHPGREPVSRGFYRVEIVEP